MEAKRTPLTALAGHRRTIGRQGQSREDLSGKNAVREWTREELVAELRRGRIEGTRSASPLKASSVFAGKEQRGHRAIRFGDDPEFFALRDLVTAEQAKPLFEAQFVFGLVVLT
jgi:hypothetical protein